MNLDYEEYLPFLEKTNLSMIEKQDVIQTIWGFVESNIDIALGDLLVQSCGYNKNNDSGNRLQVVELNKLNELFNEISANDDIYKRKA